MLPFRFTSLFRAGLPLVFLLLPGTAALAQKDGVYTSWEKAIQEPEQVLALHLGGKRIAQLPSGIGRFRRLQVLKLENNLLDSLPAELYMLDSLETLNLGGNRLRNLSADMAALGRLKQLNLENNLLKELPDTFYRLEYLE